VSFRAYKIPLSNRKS